jgi:hypothetical protein
MAEGVYKVIELVGTGIKHDESENGGSGPSAVRTFVTACG